MKYNQINMQLKQKGATTSEFMFWSLVAIGVLVGLLGILSQNMSTSSSNLASSNIQSIRTGLKQARGMTSSYAGIFAENLSVSKSVSTTLSLTGTGAASVLTAPDGTSFKVVPGTTSTTIQATMPADVCMKVLPNLDSTWTTIGGKPTPLSPGDVQTVCKTQPVELVTG